MPDRSAGVQQGRREWRVGRKVRRTVYAMVGPEASDDDVLIGLFDTPALALEAVVARNGGCPADRCVLEEGHAGRHCMGTGEEFTVHEGVIVAVDRGPEPKVEADRELSRGDETNSTTTTSVASVLRLTASRLRDPEHRWSEDPAVTLERLAEKLEKEDR